MNTKLPVPFTNAKTMLGFLNSTQITSQKLLNQRLAFSGPHSNITQLFQHLSTNSVLLKAWKIIR